MKGEITILREQLTALQQQVADLKQQFAHEAYVSDKRKEERESAERQVSALTTLVSDIRSTVNLLPSVTGLSPIKDDKDIPLAIRDLQECYKDAARSRNGQYTKLQAEVAALKESLKQLPMELRGEEDSVTALANELFLEPQEPQFEAIRKAFSHLRQQQREQDARFDFRAHLQRQREFSEKTFGPGARTQGVIDHIRKELCEIEADPSDISEWIDVTILALDGAWRAGYSPEQIIAALVAKQDKNEKREWPDWRTADPNKAIEHVKPIAAAIRSGE